MHMRTLAAAIGVLAAVTAASPTVVAEPAGENDGFTGYVTVTIERNAGLPGPGYRVSGTCAFTATRTLTDTLVVTYAGTATATGPADEPIPWATLIHCGVQNADADGSDWKSHQVLLNGSTSAMFDSTLFNNGRPKDWPLKGVTICAFASANWLGSRVDTPYTCLPPQD